MQFNPNAINSAQNIAAAYSGGVTWIKTQAAQAFVDPTTLYSGHLVDSTDSNAVSMVVNASAVAPKYFQYVVPSDKNFVLLKQNIIICDGAITMLKFGGLAALTNGCYWRIVDASDNVKFNFHSGAPIVANFEFFNVSSTSVQIQTGSDFLAMDFLSSTLSFAPVLQAGWKLQFVIRDNLTGIDQFQSCVVGQLIPTDTDVDY